MATKIFRPKTHAEWLALRGSGIGSSEVATILHLNPYDTPYQLWRRKVGIDPPIPENFAMRAGHYLEDAVARFYSDATGVQIIKRSAADWIVRSADKPFLQVSPDRTFWLPGLPHSGANKGILECKTTQLDIDPDQPPMHWFCQLQYQLGVAQLPEGALAWLRQGRDFGYKRIAFDSEFFDYMVQEVERFWVDCVQGKQEPLASNVDDILLRNPRHVPAKTAQADEQMILEAAELKGLKDQLAELEARKKSIEASLKMAIADAEALVTPEGITLATWKAAKDSVKFDEKRFAAENPALYEQYQSSVPGSRRFLVK